MDEILKLITGNLDPIRRKQVLSEINENPEAKDFYKKAKTGWTLISTTQQAPKYKIEQSYRNIQAKISLPKPISFVFRYAAIIILLIGISSIMFYFVRNNSESPVQYTSVIADFGQISKIVLPDSSVVWLNSGTTLTYNSDFSFTNRDLSLSGQAFFEVRKDKKIPLVVSGGDLKVKVLGTRFDVCAYPGESEINIVLESGSIELLHEKNEDFSYKLKPGERAEYDLESKTIGIEETGISNYADWKGGVLRFMNAPMAEVIKMLERKFDVEFIVNNPKIYHSVFNANFKNESLTEILDFIQFSCSVSYKVIKENESTRVELY